VQASEFLRISRLSYAILIPLGAAACSSSPTFPPGVAQLVVMNCMVSQTTQFWYVLDRTDTSQIWGLAPATMPTPSFLACTESQTFPVSNGTHHLMIRANGSCSGMFTAMDEDRPFRSDTLLVSLFHTGATGTC